MSNYNPPIDPQTVRPLYSKSLSSDKILMTGHSHRAWPDCAEEGQLWALQLAYDYADFKWDVISGEVIPKFQSLIAQRTGISDSSLIANGENTHELVTRVLSCFPWDNRTHIVTTTSEFHSLKRQLYRLQEEGVHVTYVATDDKTTLTDRIIESITPKTNIIALSTTFFNDGYILQNVPAVIERARKVGATTVLDGYHDANTRPLNIDALGEDIFFTAGGYKYAHGGEGAAWLKVPTNCTFRPRITGWFADFAALEAQQYPSPVCYGEAAQRFLGATRDISGICRQIAVLEMMNKVGLTVNLLRQNTVYQTQSMIDMYDHLDLEQKGLILLSSRNHNQRGSFIALETDDSNRADSIKHHLWERDRIIVDTRGKILRLGPAPYTTEEEIVKTVQAIQRAA